MQKVIKLLLLCMYLFSCNTSGDLQPAKYLRYMESNNSTRQTIISGNTEYIIQLATADYMACREYSEQLQDTNTELLKSRINELEGHIFFIINVSKNDLGGSVIDDIQKKQKAGEMIMYYQSLAANDISLFCDEQQFFPATYHYEDNYGLAPYNTIVVGFQLPELQSGLKLVFNDRYNDNPYIQATYSKKTLKNLPTLVIK